MQFLLMVNSNRDHITSVCEIFSHIEAKNGHFANIQQYQCNLYIAEKYINGLQFCHWQYGSIFIRLAVVA